MKKLYLCIVCLMFLAGLLVAVGAPLRAEDDNMYAAEPEKSGRPFEVSLYGSLGGYGGLYTLGGELLLIKRQLGLNVGYASYSMDFDLEEGSESVSVDITMIPLTGAYYLGDRHRFYLEGGVVYCNIDLGTDQKVDDYDFINDIPSAGAFVMCGGIGYNYNPAGFGFFFKTGVSFLYYSGYALPWGNVSFGISF